MWTLFPGSVRGVLRHYQGDDLGGGLTNKPVSEIANLVPLHRISARSGHTVCMPRAHGHREGNAFANLVRDDPRLNDC